MSIISVFKSQSKDSFIDVEVSSCTPLVINSKPMAVISGNWYKVSSIVEGQDIPTGLAYISLIWGSILGDVFKELNREILVINIGTHEYTFIEKAPAGATHLIIGYRANCEGAFPSVKKYKIRFLNPDSCKLQHLNQLYARLLKSLLNPHNETIDLNVEFVTYCNLRCRWCALDHNKKKEIMHPELFKKTLTRAVNSKLKVRRIDLHNAGETLLHPDFNNMMHILHTMRSNHPDFPYVALLTNGMMLEKEKSEILIETGCIDLLRISVDGGTVNDYHRIRTGGNFERVYQNAMNFIKVNNASGHRIVIGIICIVDHGHPLNTEWMSDEFKTLLASVDYFELRRPHNWDGSVDLGITEKITNTGRCSFINNNNLVVLPGGYVTVCCADLNSRGVIGNICDGDLDELINNKKRKDMIKLMDQGKRNIIELCQNCNIP